MAIDCVKLIIFVFICISFNCVLCLKREDCEVCVNVMDNFHKSLSPKEKTDRKVIELKFKEFCVGTKGKDNKFCYYIGGLETSATGILTEMSRPLHNGLPPESICMKLHRLDGQICDLRYEKTIDFKTVDLKKLKVKQLMKILSNWDEDCEGCLEKTDYIKRIEELKPKYVRDEL